MVTKSAAYPAVSPADSRAVNLSGIRKSNLPYVLSWVGYYAWVIAFSTWWTASPLTGDVMGSDIRSLLHIMNLLSSAVFVFILPRGWFAKTAHIGALLIVGGMAAFLLAGSASIRLAATVIMGIAIGCVNISILMPFVFTLNNTEKLYAVVGSNVLINILPLLTEGDPVTSGQNGKALIYSLVLLVVALSATLFFRKDAVTEEAKPAEPGAPKVHIWLYLTLVLNCVFTVLCKGAGKGVLNIAVMDFGTPVLTWYSIGGLLGCALYILVYTFSKKCIYIAWNITFGSMIMGLLLNAFSADSPSLSYFFSILAGISATMGMINMYYILGVIGKKYNSMKYIRLSILLIGICGGVAGVVLGNLITDINTFQASIVASVISSGVFLLILMFSPALAPVYYEDEWAKDSEKMEVDNDRLSVFRKYKLSNRETEVCALLLQGYTMRQISGILSLKYPTVNTYCTSAYRKLHINSRTELLLLFRDYAAESQPNK